MKKTAILMLVFLNMSFVFSQTITSYSNKAYVNIEKVNKPIVAYSNESNVHIIPDRTKPTITITTDLTIKYAYEAKIKGKVYDKNGIKNLKINNLNVNFDDSGNFTHDVSLTKKENLFTIVATDKYNNTKSETIKLVMSDKLTATQTEDNTKPVIKLHNNFSEEQSNPMVLKGSVSDENGISYVALIQNDDRILITDKVGDFEHTITLPEKINTIKIKAVDKNSNKTDTSYIITRKANFKRNEKDFAIFFAVNDYNHLQGGSLTKPVSDVKTISEILINKYGYEESNVVIKNNPTRKDIIETLKSHKLKFDKKGQLLIFFSGHGGVYDINKGYFIPTNSNINDISGTNYLYSDLREYVSSLSVKHVLIFVDACFSAYLDPDFEIKKSSVDSPPWDNEETVSKAQEIINNHLLYKTRKFITSDSRGKTTPENSQLTTKFIEALKNYQSPSEVFKFYDLWDKYLKNAKPSPHIGNFCDNEKNSTFIFVRKK